MFVPLKFVGTSNVTSSPASPVGRSHCNSQDGPQTDLSGQARVRANRSRTQDVKAAGSTTNDISGLSSFGSSASAVLQSCLENRLRARTQSLGSTLYSLTWKAWTTPAGRLLSRLRASAPRTSETARTGWVTPTARDWKDSGADIRPRSDNGKQRYDQLPRQAVLCGWPTPLASDSTKRGKVSPRKGAMALPETVNTIGPQRLTVSGEVLTGLDAEMRSGGLLNQEHSRWLMGFLPEWSNCAPTATRSTRSKVRSSSKP